MTSNNSKPSQLESDNQTSQENYENQNEIDDIDSSPSATTNDIPSFGWSEYAERVNGRFAMIGFSAILIIETISHSGFLHWAGLVP